MEEQLKAIQNHFHGLIHLISRGLAESENVSMPTITDLRNSGIKESWLPIPGMYGGFSYKLTEIAGEPVLVVESWSRILEGSGQRHEITGAGYVLLEEGFV